MTSDGEEEAIPWTTTVGASGKSLTSSAESRAADEFAISDTDLSKDWHGPVPSPEVLAAYARISPDLPGRLLHLVEVEARFQQEMYEKTLNSARRSRRFGLVTIVAIWLLSMAVGVYSLVRGGDPIAFTIGPAISVLVSAVGFYFARYSATAESRTDRGAKK